MKKILPYIEHIVHLSIIPCTILFLMSAYHAAYADTIKLKDGSVLVGKIIKNENKIVEFSNSFGTFTIKKKDITKLFTTESYAEDITINKNLGKKISNNEMINIKRNYMAGEKNKKKIEATEKSDDSIDKKKKKQRADDKKNTRKAYDTDQKWVNGRLSFSGSFMWIFSKISNAIPYLFNGHFALDQGLDMIIKKRHALMPGIRFEYSYMWGSNDGDTLTGHNGSIGLIWAFPSMKNSWGNFVLMLMPGVSFLDIQKADKNDIRITTLSAQGVFGYQYSYKAITVFIHARYMYIYDKDILFQSFGGEFGIGFNCW